MAETQRGLRHCLALHREASRELTLSLQCRAMLVREVEFQEVSNSLSWRGQRRLLNEGGDAIPGF